VNAVPDLNKATALAATGQTKAAAAPRIKLLPHGFSIDHRKTGHVASWLRFRLGESCPLKCRGSQDRMGSLIAAHALRCRVTPPAFPPKRRRTYAMLTSVNGKSFPLHSSGASIVFASA